MGRTAESRALSSSAETATATRYAERLLSSLGLKPRTKPSCPEEHPAITWAHSGLMALTGLRDGQPLMCPLPLAACADGALAALAGLASSSDPFAGMRGSQLLGERAAVAGLSRNGAVSPGGACRLLEAADGSVAVNLARPDDWELVPAWLECALESDWTSLARIIQHKQVAVLLERGRLLGLAVAKDEVPSQGSTTWFSATSSSPRRRGSSTNKALFALGSRFSGNDEKNSPLVVDLSSLWAGPLCSHLLQKFGARVVKVESPVRPDGARQGPAVIFNLLNAGKQSVALDPRLQADRDQLRALLARADIVIEGSRPRALRQIGIHAEDLIQENPGLTWVSITGHGRGEPQENWIAYGDDAGVAAGLSSVMARVSGHRILVGDAIADPLAGLHAALAAWAGYLGGGGLYALSLYDVVRHCAAFEVPASGRMLAHRQREWTRLAREAGAVGERPQLRRQWSGWAPALGADTNAVLTELCTNG